MIPRRSALAIPPDGVFDPPLVGPGINGAWASHIVGVLDVLLQADAWEGTESEVFQAQQEVEKLIKWLGS